MFKSLLRDRLLLVLFFTAVLIRILAFSPAAVERYYSDGFYPVYSRLLRLLTGWIPFSLGDILYIIAALWLIWKFIKFGSLLLKRQLKTYLSRVLLRKYLKLILWIYIIFNISWGLNYNREGIPRQFDLSIGSETRADLQRLVLVLQDRMRDVAQSVDINERPEMAYRHQLVFEKAFQAYDSVKPAFLKYSAHNMKTSIFSPIAHFLGFTGYFNPFTGESQLNVSVPVYVQPFVACHEIGHQIGYAKENEANFIGFMAGHTAPDPAVRYSAYADMYAYAMRQLSRDSFSLARSIKEKEPPLYAADRKSYLEYLLKSRNNVEPLVSNFYDGYLRLNNQPKGKATYDEVVQWLIAYMKKYGEAGI